MLSSWIQSFHPVIGDRVSIEIRIGGYNRGTLKGTVLYWTPSRRISVKLDGKGEVKNVSPEQIKKECPNLFTDHKETFTYYRATLTYISIDRVSQTVLQCSI